MTPRTDLMTASRIDLALILLPLIGRRAAAKMLVVSRVPAKLAVRVLTWPDKRRPERGQGMSPFLSRNA